MKHYVLATQQEWGVKAFNRLLSESPFAPTRRSSPGLHLAQYRDALDAVPFELVRYVFCLNWSSYVPPEVLAVEEVVNFHCTALPYGRGGGPIENLLLRGHAETVITAHRMVEELDAGPIYKVSGPVSLAGTKDQILERFIQPCVELIRWIIEHEPEPYPQVGEIVTFKRLPKAEMEALWKAKTW